MSAKYGSVLTVVVLSAGMAWSADVVMRPGGEVATIQAAVERVRRLRAEGTIPAGRVAEVRVESGRYPVASAATFAPADSAIAFTAAEPGRAVFDGGVRLPPFTAGADGIWRVRVPAGFAFEQLYVNGRRADVARTPNRFYLYMREPWDGRVDPRTGKSADLSRSAFMAEAKDIAPLAALPPDELARVVVLGWQSWDQGRARVACVDGATGAVVMQSGMGFPLFHWSESRPRYSLENYRAALDAPGEWFHDVKAGELLYIPRAGERPETTAAVAPIAPGFVVFAGHALAGACVSNVTFRGLVFEHCGWTMPAGGATNQQSAQNIRTAAIFGDGVRSVTLDRCVIRHVGVHGVWFKRGCRDCVVSHCRIEDLGGGGVYLGDTADWREEKPERLSGFNRVSDNIIRGGGLTFGGAIGVWIGHASDNLVEHNDIGDFRYTGVSMGWTWGCAPTVTKRNRLLWNRIHHIGQGYLSDMGGVYTLGDSSGTVEIGNWIHDVNGYAGTGSPAWGLYTDEGSHGILFASNLVERCRDGAVHQHYGRENVWANNIFATFDRNGVWRSRVEDHTTVIVTNNVFWWTNPEAHLLSGTARTTVKDVVFDGNLYWGVNGLATNAFSGRALAAWQAEGHDRASRVADPKFADPAKGDWRLAPDSPARAMGFVPWDWTFAGVLKDDPAWRAAAMDDSAIPPLADAPKAPRFIRVSARQDFEAFPLGSQTAYGALSPDAPAGISVVKGGCTGRQALRLEDGPDPKFDWQPHLISHVCCEKDRARIRFAFRLEDGVACPQFECRDYHPADGRPYAAGPLLAVRKGALYARDRRLGPVATGVWHTAEVVLRVTGEKALTWDCTVTPAGGAPLAAAGLPVDMGFRVLEWVGFMTPGRTPCAWLLDDYSVEPY